MTLAEYQQLLGLFIGAVSAAAFILGLTMDI